MANPAFSPSGAVRAGALEGSLRPRIVGLAESLSGPSWCAILIEEGSAELAGDGEVISGPVLAWRQWSDRARVRFAAGTVGAYVLLGTTALANAVGHMPESRELRDIADSDVTLPLRDAVEIRAAMSASFQGILRELGSDGVAAQAVVEAHLRVILIEILRSTLSRLGGPGGKSPSHRVFRRYSTLVEQHFRDRWSVNAYAESLGVTRDRLGDVCRRVRGVGPKELIDRRVMLEARLQLETSGRSVQEIAGDLGFGSAAQFSRFFSRHARQPPGIYRASVLGGLQKGASDAPRPFDWP